MAALNTTNKVIVTPVTTIPDSGSITDAGKKLNFSVSYRQVYKTLKSDYWGRLIAPPRLEQALYQGAQTIISYKPRRQVLQNWTSARTLNPAGEQKPGTNSIATLINFKKQYRMEVPADDYNLFNITNAGDGNLTMTIRSLTAMQAQAIQAIAMYMKAKAVSEFVGWIKRKGQSGKPNPYITEINVPLSAGGDLVPSEAMARKKVFWPIYNKMLSFRNKITASSLGFSNYALFVNAETYEMLIQATILYADTSRQVLLDGQLDKIAGMPVIYDGFIGLNIPKGTVSDPKATDFNAQAFDKDEAFDFSGFNAVLLPNIPGLFFWPYAQINPLSTVMLPTDKSIWTYAAFAVCAYDPANPTQTGIKVIYPEYIHCFKFVKKSPTSR